jgi:hypothetical protein
MLKFESCIFALYNYDLDYDTLKYNVVDYMKSSFFSESSMIVLRSPFN